MNSRAYGGEPGWSHRLDRRASSLGNWLQLSKALIKLDAANELTVLETLLENIGKRGAITDSLGPDGDRYLDGLVSRNPPRRGGLYQS